MAFWAHAMCLLTGYSEFSNDEHRLIDDDTALLQCSYETSRAEKLNKISI